MSPNRHDARSGDTSRGQQMADTEHAKNLHPREGTNTQIFRIALQM